MTPLRSLPTVSPTPCSPPVRNSRIFNPRNMLGTTMTTLQTTVNPTDRRCASGTRNEIPVGAIGIRLTNGMIALVDEADYPKVQGFTWQALRSCDGNYVRWYAYTKVARTRKSIRMHRLLLNPPTGMVVDHK